MSQADALCALETPSPRRWRILTALLLVVLGVGRIAYLTSDAAPDLAHDEAHYWDWSRHLDWSYYSKGPLVAYLIRGSCELLGPWSQALIGNHMIAVRMPAILSGLLLLVGLYLLTVQVFHCERLAFLVVFFATLIPLFSLGGLLITIDAPFTCLWVWASVFGHYAIIGQRAWAWPVTGVLVALGILAKYTMLFWLGSVGLFLLATPSLRGQLFRPGFWSMVLISNLAWLPIVWWNAQHQWVTFAHVGNQAGLMRSSSQSLVRWHGPLEYLGGQLAMLLGGWFVAWVSAIWVFRPRPNQEPRLGIRYLWWLSVPTFVIFALFSLKTKVQMNWPVTAYLSGFILTVAVLWDRITHSTGTTRWVWRMLVILACGFSATATLLMHDLSPIRPLLARFAPPQSLVHPCPIRKVDPTTRLRGWAYLGQELDRFRGELAQQGIANPVLATTPWNMPGVVAFYCADQPTVYSLGPRLGDRHSQYDFWHPNPVSEPSQFQGQTFVFIGPTSGPILEVFRLAFDRVELGRIVTYTEQNFRMGQWAFWVGYNYRGFPTIPGITVPLGY